MYIFYAVFIDFVRSQNTSLPPLSLTTLAPLGSTISSSERPSPVTIEYGTTPSLPNIPRKIINVGLLFVLDNPSVIHQVGYRTSAAAVMVAQDEIRKDHLLDGYDFNFTVRFDECVEARAVGMAVDLILNENVDVIIGPTCNSPAIATAVLASFYNIPIYTWGLTTSSDLADVQRYPTTIILSPNYYHLSIALLNTLSVNDWHEFAFIYSSYGDTETCSFFRSDLQSAISDLNNRVVISYNYEFATIDNVTLNTVLQGVKSRARIIVVCLAEGFGYKRDLMLAAFDNNMVTDEYVYLFPGINSRGFSLQMTNGTGYDIWTDVRQPPDRRDGDAKTAFKRVFMISDTLEETLGDAYANFGKEVIRRMSQAPFNCSDCYKPEYQQVSTLAGHLFDAMYIYANVVNKTIDSMGEDALRNGSALLLNIPGVYTGMPSPVTIADNGGMVPHFFVAGLNTLWDVLILADIKVSANGTTAEYSARPDNDQAFGNYANGKPLTVPKCGFTGTACPVDFIQQYLVWVVVGIVLILLAITAAVLGIAWTIRARVRENERLNMMWRVPWQTLTRIKQKSMANSHMSLQSGGSHITGNSHNTTQSNSHNSIESKIPLDENIQFFYLAKEPVMGVAHNVIVRIDHNDFLEMRQLRQMEHDNINRFIGLSIDGPNYFSLWKYCQRGSIQDVIHKGNMPMDSFFVYALLMDIVNGLHFLHNSFLKKHGTLTSKSCLVDDRWQVKLSQFGLSTIRRAETPIKEELLWTAPELLRLDNFLGTSAGDIYSFAIIASELVCKTGPYDLENRNETAEEIVHMVMKSSNPPFRPDLDHSAVDINPTMLHLIRDCWADSAAQRPDSTILRTLMKNMYNGRKINLMDHVLSTLEEHAGNLEREVEERMKELVEEKKKSDLLLYRMLPRQVAEKLKLGQPVEPEGYDKVTIFFSDVVGFTTIAARCTPLQVVSLLNSLYTIFDATIEMHDVYKVETIGDAYLCVSGLPKRNGNEHIKEVADMSLELIQALKSFRIVHLNNESVQIRVGMHSGPCVAGVVGLSMPRYCLFGDTVNTASRMESNGKPSHIHMSKDAYEFMVAQYRSEYETEPRGEVLIKGKGVMETYWLHGRASDGAGNFSPGK